MAHVLHATQTNLLTHQATVISTTYQHPVSVLGYSTIYTIGVRYARTGQFQADMYLWKLSKLAKSTLSLPPPPSPYRETFSLPCTCEDDKQSVASIHRYPIT